MSNDAPMRGEEREYLRITPATSEYSSANIPDILATLHKLAATTSPRGRMKQLFSRTDLRTPATYEFVALSEGNDQPVEFYFGANTDLYAVEDRFTSIYPKSFDIEHTSIDLVSKLLPAVEYSHEEFVERLNNRQLYYNPDAEASATDSNALPAADESRLSSNTIAGTSHAEPSESVVSYDGGTCRLAPSTTVPTNSTHITGLDRPARTADGTILARPPLTDVTPYGVQWKAQTPKDDADWMTTLTTLSDWQTQTHDDDSAVDELVNAPLATLVDVLTRATTPLGFRVVFTPHDDWSETAEERRYNLEQQNINSGVGRAIDGFVRSILTTPKEVRRRSDHRIVREAAKEDPGPREGSLDRLRLDLLRDIQPEQTFTVNINALGLLPEEDTAEHSSRMTQELMQLRSALDRLDGPLYKLQGTQVGPRDSGNNPAESLLQQFCRHDIIIRGGFRIRSRPYPDFVMDPDELASFILVPPTSQLSAKSARSTQPRQRSRTPIPGPRPEHLSLLQDGMAIGQLMDENGRTTGEEIHIPPAQLTLHFILFAASGSGKSVGSINSTLSLDRNTQGPEIIIDAKGGGMLENFMRSYAAEHGTDALEENVLYFPIPDVLPGLSPFDIRSPLANGVDRVDAVQDSADYYEEILKLVIGEERYERATVAPNLIRYLFKALYDEEHGLQNGRVRASTDYFRHDQLENVLDQLWAAGPPNPDPSALPQSENEQVRRFLNRLIESDEQTFQNMMRGMVSRIDYISRPDHLRRLFNNVEKNFDFRDYLDTDTIILFDLGGLRQDSAKTVSVLLIMMLHYALKENAEWLSQQPEDYLVNLLIDEAPYLTVSDTMNTLLEQGREFRLSVGMCAQFPEQLRYSGDEKVYLNALNNIKSPIVGNIRVSDRIAEALATEDMPPKEVRSRLRSMPPGEWLVRLPSLSFGETAPKPFGVKPLAIPPGHPDSDAPFTNAEEAQFQEVLDGMTDQIDEEYGIVEEDSALFTTVPDPVRELLGIDSADLDHVLAHVVGVVQQQHCRRDTNEFVNVEAVAKQLRASYAAANRSDDAPVSDTLTTIYQRSPLFTVDGDGDAHAVAVQLTDEGEDIITTDLGLGDIDGGDPDHTKPDHAALAAIDDALTAHGFTVTPVSQNSTDTPDVKAKSKAKGTHPDLDQVLNFEAGTTPDVPSNVLTNLRKAQEDDRYPVFVVEAVADDLTYWAREIESILSPPIKRTDEDGVEYYPADEEPIVFAGDPKIGGDVTAVRSRVDDDATVWKHEPARDEAPYVLYDGEGNEYTRLETIADPKRFEFPGLYRYDQMADMHVVYLGTETRTYRSQSEFTDEWVVVQQPIIPEEVFSDPTYDRSDYAIVITPTGESDDGTEPTEPVVYTPAGEVAPIDTLTEIVRSSVDPTTEQVSIDSE